MGRGNLGSHKARGQAGAASEFAAGASFERWLGVPATRRRLGWSCAAAIAGVVCGIPAAAQSPATPGSARAARVRALLVVLAADSLEGRGTGTAGATRAARFIAGRMRAIGLTPAGDSGYFQRVPLALAEAGGDTVDRRRPELLASLAARDSVPAARRLPGVNVVGVLRGADPALRAEAVLVDAHYDHLGIGPPVAGDSIYNGADDDASGVVAVLEIARRLARGRAPRRTVVFLATTGEEVGLLGTRWYVAHPVVPIALTVANLEIEMIGRPDLLAGGPGRGWLTGYERSTMGDMLREHGVPIVADPRPAQNFFMRSDNIAFAYLGVPAHTLSSFNLHADYHTPADEAGRVDADHMARLIDAAARAVRLLADGPKPVWKPGGRPVAEP
jgi:hypothetical protein